MKATTKKSKKTNKPGVALILLLSLTVILTIVILSTLAKAQPTGIAINSNISVTAGDTLAPNRTDPGGTITTLEVSITQQNTRWKAYLGNLTGELTLDDANQNTIFRWAMGAESITGEIYVSRNNSVSWTGIRCANVTEIEDEDTFLTFNSLAVDTINRTYNGTTHPLISVGTTNVPANNCRSTSTYVADAPQPSNPNFPAVLLSNNNNNALIYVSPLNQGNESYIAGEYIDFQILVANNPADTTTYYFYAEIGS